MSLYAVQSFMFRLKQDTSLQRGLERRDEGILAAFSLEERERKALLAGDVAELFRMGVHPLLLAPFSRFAGLSAAQYRTVMGALKGVRKLRSEQANRG
jgi:hypothetical protein